jgi:hypothetical protein
MLLTRRLERWQCDGRGECSGVFVFFLHMGMGKIHWREEVDPIINGIKDRDIFLHKRYFFQHLLFGACFYLVGDVGWDRMLIRASYLQNPTIVGFLFLIA